MDTPHISLGITEPRRRIPYRRQSTVGTRGEIDTVRKALPPSAALNRVPSLRSMTTSTVPNVQRKNSQVPLLRRAAAAIKSVPDVASQVKTVATDFRQLMKQPNADIANKSVGGIRYGDAALAIMGFGSIGHDYKNLIPRH